MLQLNRQRFSAVLTVVAVCLGQDGLLNAEEFLKNVDSRTSSR